MNPNQTQRGNASQKCHNRTCVFLHVWYKYLLDLFVCLFCASWLPQEWRNWRLPALFSKVCMKRRDVTSPSSPSSSSGITKFLICLMVYLFPDFFSWLIHNYCSMRSYRWLSDNSRLHNNHAKLILIFGAVIIILHDVVTLHEWLFISLL